MDLPIPLKQAIEAHTSELKTSDLVSHAQNLSKSYRFESGKSKRFVTQETEATAYALFRMPATFGAVSKSLAYTLDNLEHLPQSLLDVGAGTGAATWAIEQQLELSEITCLEREKAMRTLGQQLMEKSDISVLQKAQWKNFDLISEKIEQKADLVCVSYVLNELSESERIKAVDKLYEATNDILLIVETGTPKAYAQLMQIRKHLISLGTNLIAPCPHTNECPLSGNDWCHFSCRISRSKIHKQMKEATMGYEDEKFSYLAVSKKQVAPQFSRVLREPKLEKHQVCLNLCTCDGLKGAYIAKRDKEAFKKAKKLSWGDSF